MEDTIRREEFQKKWKRHFNLLAKCTVLGIREHQPDDIIVQKKDVDYPILKKYTYYSQTAERDTDVNIILPANYSEEKKYPVLYILHGYGDDEDWMAQGSVGLVQMLGNLNESKEAEEMIIVLPYIYCSKDMPVCTGMDLENSLNYDNFINDLTTDLMPFVENNFSVAKGRKNTAITGFSMGGRESMFIGITRSDLFGYVGAVCPAPGLTPGVNLSIHPGQMEEEELMFKEDSPYLFFISAAKNDEIVGNSPLEYHNILEANQVRHLWHVISDSSHGPSSVKPHLYNFLRFIFKADEKEPGTEET